MTQEDLIGKTIFKEWHVEEVLGSGGYGLVYKASRDLGGDKMYAAVKHIIIPDQQEYKNRLRAMHNSISLTDQYFQGIYQDITAEIKTMFQLKGNSNIVAYLDHEIKIHQNPAKYEIFILMEYLTELGDYCHANDMTAADIIKMGIATATGLEICHKKGIMHRDIKESNIFVNDDGTFKLGDFGLAKILSECSKAASDKGTGAYKAPEVAVVYGEYNKTIDIYSLGIVLYRMFNHGRIPFLPPYPESYGYGDETAALAKRLSGEPFPAPRAAASQISEVILTASAFSPDDRYQTAGELKMALQLLLNNLSATELEKVVMAKGNNGEKQVIQVTEGRNTIGIGKQIDIEGRYKHKDIFESDQVQTESIETFDYAEIDAKLWAIAFNVGTIESFLEYLQADNPSKSHINEASERLAALEARQKAEHARIDGVLWAEALKTGTLESFSQYLQAENLGRSHANEASKRIAAINEQIEKRELARRKLNELRARPNQGKKVLLVVLAALTILVATYFISGIRVRVIDSSIKIVRSVNQKSHIDANGNSGKYTGIIDAVSGSRIGQGTYVYANGDIYVGDFQDDKRHGEGILTSIKGDVYDGDWHNDKRTGHGTWTYVNGDKYVGDLIDDKANGQGIYTWASGDQYTGEFKDDQLNGQGTYTWADAKIKPASGLWKDGKLQANQ